MLQNVLTHPSSTLTCIDLFRQSDESYAYCRLLHFPNLDSYIPSDVLFDRIFDERIAAVGGTDRVIKIISDSESALRTLPMDSYDCVYVDGSHTSRNVLTDLVLSWGLLKLGGVLIIDDYTLQSFQDNPLKNPGIGIDAFLMVFQDEHEVLHAAGQIILRKTAHRDDIWKTKAVAALTAAI